MGQAPTKSHPEPLRTGKEVSRAGPKRTHSSNRDSCASGKLPRGGMRLSPPLTPVIPECTHCLPTQPDCLSQEAPETQGPSGPWLRSEPNLRLQAPIAPQPCPTSSTTSYKEPGPSTTALACFPSPFPRKGPGEGLFIGTGSVTSKTRGARLQGYSSAGLP